MNITFNRNNKEFAVLIDPGKTDLDKLRRTILNAHNAKADYIFIGGSIHTNDKLDETISFIRDLTNTPVVLFPGSALQISKQADAMLFMSLISGRNPELLIGHQVLSAPLIKEKGLKTISTGYMLIENGHTSSVGYMSNTMPIPREKNAIAVATAMAGEMLGLSCIFMDAGSGASQPIKPEMIRAVHQNTSIPLIIGGGINTPEQLRQAYENGANIVVIGNALETNPDLVGELLAIRDQFTEKGL